MELEKGAEVLFAGHNLTVTALEERTLSDDTAVTLAVCEDVPGVKRREELKARFQEVRAKIPDLSPEAREEAHEELLRLDEEARDALFRVKLRADLLDYWEEREVWVSDGRIMTDDQKEQWKMLTGSYPKPKAERQALVMLEKGGS